MCRAAVLEGHGKRATLLNHPLETSERGVAGAACSCVVSNNA